MKHCPSCNRTYSDETLAFCLEDGTLLSAQYDPEETKQIYRPLDKDSVLTRVSFDKSTIPNPTQVIPTVESSSPLPTVFSGIPQSQNVSKMGGKLLLVAAGVLVGIVAVSIVGLLVWVAASKNSAVTNTSIVSNNNSITQNKDRGQINSNVLPPPEKKKESGFSPWNYQASMNGENLTYYPGTTPEQCQADCAKNEKCKGFTYIRAGAYNPNDSAMCYQASYVSEFVTHPCCISAVKR